MARRKITPNSVMAQVEDEVNRELDELIPAIAAEEGLARGAVHVSPDKEVELWGQRDPRVDYDSLKQQLMTGQVSRELFDPQSDARLALVRAQPEWSDWIAQHVTPETPLDDDLASQVASAAEWPFRTAVLAPYQNDPRSYVTRAERIHQRWTARQGAPSEQSAPIPEERGYR